MRSRRVLVALLSVLVAAGCSAAEPGALFEEERAVVGADYEFLIPAGTGAALDAGEDVEILPAELEVAVGEVIEIVNEDDRGHMVGPFWVGEGETLRQRFSTPGEYVGQCTVHPGGELILTVNE